MIATRLPHRIAGATHERKPHLHSSRRKHLRRHYPHDGVWLIAEIKCATEHARITVEYPLPQAIADYGERRAANPVFLLCENSSDLWCEPDDFVETRGYERT